MKLVDTSESISIITKHFQNGNETIKIDLPIIDEKHKAIVILSGGLDSTILTYLLHDHAIIPNMTLMALSFNYNQRHKIELEQAAKTCDKLKIEHKILNIEFFSDIIQEVSALSGNKKIDVPDLDQVTDICKPITYVPYRNQLFLTLAASVAESNYCSSIFIGAQAGDLYGYWDCTPIFIEEFNNLIHLNKNYRLSLYAPFVNLSKSQEIIIGNYLNVNFADTHSCYRGVDELGRSCGTCPTCQERLKNFKEVGIKDPLPYVKSE